MSGVLFPTDYINNTNPLWWGLDYIRRKSDGHIITVTHPNKQNNPALQGPGAGAKPWTDINDGRLWVSVWDNSIPSNAGAPQELEANGCFAGSIGERSDGTIDLFYSKNDQLCHRFSRDGGLSWSVSAVITPPNISNVGFRTNTVNHRQIQHCYYGKSGLLVLTFLANGSAPLPSGNTFLVVGQLNPDTQRWILSDPYGFDSRFNSPSVVISNLQNTRDGKVYLHGCAYKLDGISANGVPTWKNTSTSISGQVNWGETYRGVAAGGGLENVEHAAGMSGWIDEPSGLLIKLNQHQNDATTTSDSWFTYLRQSDSIWQEQPSGPPFATSGFGGPQGIMDKWRLDTINSAGFHVYQLGLYGIIRSRSDGRWEWMFPLPITGEINYKLTRNMSKGLGTIWS